MPKACYILRVNKVHRVLSQPIELREKKKKAEHYGIQDRLLYT